MKISYINTDEDLLAFTDYHLSKSPAQKRRHKSVLFVTSFFLMVYAMVKYQYYGLLKGVLHGLLSCLVFIALYLLLTKKSMTGITKDMLGEGKNKGYLCRHTLELVDDGLVEETEVGTQKAIWSGIERIAENDAYFFIYLGAYMAHVIPKGRTEGDLNELIRVLKEKTAESSV